MEQAGKILRITVLRALKVRVAILNDASVDGQPVKFVFKIRDYRIHVKSEWILLMHSEA